MNLIESSDEKVIEKSVCQHKKSSKNKIVFNNIYNISRITKFKIRNKFKVNFQWPFFHSEITFELKDLMMFYKIYFPTIFRTFLPFFWLGFDPFILCLEMGDWNSETSVKSAFRNVFLIRNPFKAVEVITFLVQHDFRRFSAYFRRFLGLIFKHL